MCEVPVSETRVPRVGAAPGGDGVDRKALLPVKHSSLSSEKGEGSP